MIEEIGESGPEKVQNFRDRGDRDDTPELIFLNTTQLLKMVQECLTIAYVLESYRSKVDQDDDPSAARLIANLKMCRGILRSRLKGGK